MSSAAHLSSSFTTSVDRQGRSFPKRLADELRTTPQFIENVFKMWITDIWDGKPDEGIGRAESLNLIQRRPPQTLQLPLLHLCPQMHLKTSLAITG